MGRKYSEPTIYRDRKCPYCGLYFSARGLTGHIRFKHPKLKSKDPMQEMWEEEVMGILNKMHTEEGLKEALRLFLTDYLINRKPTISGR